MPHRPVIRIQRRPEEIRVDGPRLVRRDPFQTLLHAVFGKTPADRFKIRRRLHVEVKSEFVINLPEAVRGRSIAVKIIFLHEAEAVDRQADPRLLFHLADDGFFGRLPELDAPADGIEIPGSGVFHHQKATILQDDRADADIDDPPAAGNADVRSHHLPPAEEADCFRSLSSIIS